LCSAAEDNDRNHCEIGSDMATLVLFEPQNLAPFGPMILLQSVADLRYGVYSNLQRVQKTFPKADIHLWVRPILAEDQRGKYPALSINQDPGDDAVFLNAAVPAWFFPKALEQLTNHDQHAVMKDGMLIAAKSSSIKTFAASFHDRFDDLDIIEADQSDQGRLPKWIWDYLDLADQAIEYDLEFWTQEKECLDKFSPGIATLGEGQIFVHHTAQVSNFIQLDASHGPIVIGADCKIGPFCSLEGPLYIGKRSIIKPSTSIKHSVIGRVCNIGGEIKGSIIHPYSNKSHSGYLGDSILGSWVNLGAGTNCSNLKNNYQPIKVSWDGNNYDTERQFLGSIVGDHSKTAIGVSLNTGTFIGTFCNIFQAGFPPRSIPSFSWGNGVHEIDKAIQTARNAMKRRGLILAETQERLIRTLADDNAPFIHF